MEGLSSSETSVLTRATRRNIAADGVLDSHRRENLKSYNNNVYCCRLEDKRRCGHKCATSTDIIAHLVLIAVNITVVTVRESPFIVSCHRLFQEIPCKHRTMPCPCQEGMQVSRAEIQISYKHQY
jgi:hypothetical protein